LDRQADLIETFLQRQQYMQGFGLLREWVVSHVLLQLGATDWLDLNHRQMAERRLGAVAELSRKSGGTEDPSLNEWGSFWNKLTYELRNAFLHQGMRPDEVRPPSKEKLDDVQTFWRRMKEENVRLPNLGGGSGKLLVCPQGNSPGVLYSALRQSKPDRCLVVCSQATEASVNEAMTKAGFVGDCEKLLFEDPYAGTDEIEGFVQRSSNILLAADEVAANLTGGTTLMGVAVQQLLQKAKRLLRPCTSFALIDKRTPDQQRADPYIDSGVQVIEIEKPTEL
jgi:hypothetical protein